MTRRLRRAFAAAAVACMLAGCTATPSTPPPAPVTPSADTSPPAMGINGAAVPVLRWTPCHQGFQCSGATVPLSYREPHGPTLNLAVIKLPATDPAHRIGSLFFNFGGPGSDGVSELVHFGQRYPEELRARFDLVSFDPRGIGASSPVNCPGAANTPPSGNPMRPAQHDAFYATATAAGKACAAGSGSLLDHLSSANVARDMDLLRQAVGDKTLNYLGYSYGTYLGGTYANLFPGNVRAIALDGTLDLVANAAGGPGQQGEPVDVRADTASAQLEELNRFFAECTQAGPACAFSGGDLPKKFADIVARLSQGPIGGTTLPELLKDIDSAFYQAGRWKALGETFAALAAKAAGASAAKPPLLDPYLPTHSTGFLAVQCVDSANPATPADYDKLATTEAARVPYFALGAVFNMAACIGWPGHDADRYLGPWNRPRANPILVINNRYDPATPLHNAQATANELGDGHLLVVDGYGHTSLNVHSACATAAMVTYFTTLATPAPGATCAPDYRPFA